MHTIRPAIHKMENQRIGEVVRLGIGKPDTIPLWFGESDIPTPSFICDAAQAAMAKGQTFYTHRRGLAPLRQEIGAYLQRLYNKDVNMERITVTGSGMTSIMIAVQCLVNNGDNIVAVSPIWPNISYAIQAMGAECRHVRLDSTNSEWQLDLDKLFAACDERTKAVFIASPGNPSGWVLPPSQQAEILGFCRQRYIWLIADEVYHRFDYTRGLSPSILDIASDDDPVFVIQSFSKSWAMTGWRLGWLIHPVTLGDRIGDLSAINNTCATTFVQQAGITALREGENFVATMVDYCRRGRDVVYSRLSAIEGVTVAYPHAGFYVFFSIAGMSDDLAFAKELFLETRVGLAPGSAFGPGNEGYLRLCIANNTDKLTVALDRIEQKLKSLRPAC